jgi:predicted MFS family arabinose efflux permease
VAIQTLFSGFCVPVRVGHGGWCPYGDSGACSSGACATRAPWPYRGRDLHGHRLRNRGFRDVSSPITHSGLRTTWFGLGAICFLLTGLAWGGWPAAVGQVEHSSGRHPRLFKLRVLYAEYALNAAGWVSHMIFLVDFVARGLNQGVRAGSECWVLFGFSAAIGPILAGYVADSIGFATTLRIAFFVEMCAVAVPALPVRQGWLRLSTVVIGTFVTGTVPLVLGRIHELIPHHSSQRNGAWSTATTVFALFQAASAYMLSFVFANSGGNYRLLFVIGAVAMMLTLVLDVITSTTESRKIEE